MAQSEVVGIEDAGSLTMSPPTPKYMEHKLRAIESYVDFLMTGVPPAYPLELYLEVSNACDLKCAMCGPFSALSDYRKTALGLQKRGFMSSENIEEQLGDILSHALDVHCFGYGEPTINPAFEDFIRLTAPYEVNVDFFSNGMHLSDRLVRLLVDNRVTQITISFSGASKSDYENIYIGGVFERVLAGIKSLADYKRSVGTAYPIITINSLAYKHHVEKFDRFVEMMGLHGVNSIVLGPVFRTNVIELDTHASIYRPWVEGSVLQRAKEIGSGLGVGVYCGAYEATAVKDNEAYELLLREQSARQKSAGIEHIAIENLKKYSRSIKQSAPQNLENGLSDNLKNVDAMSIESADLRSLYEFLPVEELDGSRTRCFEPFKTLYITKNLDAKPCCNAVVLAPSIPIGSLDRNTGKEIWDGQPIDLIRRGIANGQYPNMCHGCMRNRNAYVHNALQEKVGRYVGWFEDKFKIPFRPDLGLALASFDLKEMWGKAALSNAFL